MAEAGGKHGGAGKAAGAGSAGGAGANAPSASSAARIDWRGVWPIPALGLGLVLLLSGVVAGVLRAPKADPAAPLEEVRALMEGARFEPAIALINTKLLPAYSAGLLTVPQQQETFLQRARALHGGQQAQGVRQADNDRSILEDFSRARELGAALSVADQVAMAEAQLSLGETVAAAETARGLPKGERARKESILRRIVERNLAQRDVQYDLTLGLLGELLESPEQTVDDRAWAIARQSELRLAMDYSDEAITRLLRAIPTLEGLSDQRRGELHYLLGRAYVQADQLAPAGRQLTLAEQLLPDSDPQKAEAIVLMGRSLQAGGKLEPARERFQLVRQQHPDAPAVSAATLGLAETSAALGDDDAAVEAFAAVLEMIRAGGAAGRRRDVSLEGIVASLVDRHAERSASGEHGRALRYARVAEDASRLLPGGETPAAVLLALGQTHRTLGLTALEDARASEAGRLPVDQVDPVTRAEVKQNLLAAAGYFREHARRVLVDDIAAHFESLWTAADCFDLAGDKIGAKEGFTAYMDGAQDDDPRKLEARFRLAQVFQAERDYVTAASLYRPLVEGRASAGFAAGGGELGAVGAGAGGPLGDRALVPLAMCYLSDDQPANDDSASQLLESVVSGGAVEPTSVIYRDALVELGELHHRLGRFPEAITRLTEAAERYGGHERIHVLRFKLADAHRQSANQIAVELQESMPPNRRAELDGLRRERLRTALGLYEEVIRGVAGKDRRKHTPMDKLALRNSHFYLGDCAFELGEFEAAINLYDAARQRYPQDPSALVAMVQIVNAYAAQGKWSEALTANERARQQLAALGESVWNTPDLPMERRHWERWLDSTALLERQARATRGAGAGGDGAGGRTAEVGGP